jgi:hypothetical protein
MKHKKFLHNYFGGEPVKSRHVTRFIRDASNLYTVEKVYRGLVHHPDYPYKLSTRRRIISSSLTVEGAACGAYSMFCFKTKANEIKREEAQIHVYEIENPIVLMNYWQIQDFALDAESSLSIEIVDGEKEMLIMAKPFSKLVKVFHISDAESNFIVNHVD